MAPKTADLKLVQEYKYDPTTIDLTKVDGEERERFYNEVLTEMGLPYEGESGAMKLLQDTQAVASIEVPQRKSLDDVEAWREAYTRANQDLKRIQELLDKCYGKLTDLTTQLNKLKLGMDSIVLRRQQTRNSVAASALLNRFSGQTTQRETVYSRTGLDMSVNIAVAGSAEPKVLTLKELSDLFLRHQTTAKKLLTHHLVLQDFIDYKVDPTFKRLEALVARYESVGKSKSWELLSAELDDNPANLESIKTSRSVSRVPSSGQKASASDTVGSDRKPKQRSRSKSKSR